MSSGEDESLEEDELDKIEEELNDYSLYGDASYLGEGQQATVVKVTHCESDKDYAAKVFKMRENEDFIQIMERKKIIEIRNDEKDLIIGNRGEGLSEVYFSLTLHGHPNIATGKEFIISKSYIFVIMEMAQSDLTTFLMRRKPSPLVRSKIIFDIGCTVEYLHSIGIIHCDLKCDNILMMSKTNASLGDLGLLRYKEHGGLQSCQTINYRAPEAFVAEGRDIIYRYPMPHFYGWTDNFPGMEIWSFGIVCLEIIYSRPYISNSSEINDTEISKKYKQWEDIPYLSLINVLLYETKNRSVCDVIVEIFGPPDEDVVDLFKLVCDKILIIRQPDRVSSFAEFLSHEYFLSKGFTKPVVTPNVQNVKIQLPLITEEHKLFNEKIYKDLDTVTNWMLNEANGFSLDTLVIMSSIDFFLQKFTEYTNSLQDFQLFACAVLWLMSSMMGHRQHTVYDYAYSSDAEEGDFQKRMIRKIKGILEIEGGIPKYESLYSYLPSMEMLEQGISFMLNSELYEKYGGPSGIADYLIKHETEEQLARRVPKGIRWLDYRKIERREE